MHHFFVPTENISNKEVRINGKDFNHIKNVLRVQPGEEISVTNGIDSKEYRCRVLEYRDDEVVLELQFIKEAGVELPVQVYLFQGLPKSDKMEMIIQKTVELGVCEIIPVSLKRCVVKLDDKKEKAKISRWQGISEAAAKQSQRSRIPEVNHLMTLQQALEYADRVAQIKMIPYELAEGMQDTRELFQTLEHGKSVAVFIGPEGGFEENEVKLAQQHGVRPISLGKRILRTETAGMAVLSWISYVTEVSLG